MFLHAGPFAIGARMLVLEVAPAPAAGHSGQRSTYSTLLLSFHCLLTCWVRQRHHQTTSLTSWKMLGENVGQLPMVKPLVTPAACTRSAAVISRLVKLAFIASTLSCACMERLRIESRSIDYSPVNSLNGSWIWLNPYQFHLGPFPPRVGQPYNSC